MPLNLDLIILFSFLLALIGIAMGVIFIKRSKKKISAGLLLVTLTLITVDILMNLLNTWGISDISLPGEIMDLFIILFFLSALFGMIRR